MADKKYTTPNGSVVMESILVDKYGQDAFNSFVNNGQLEQVYEEEDRYTTPNGTEMGMSALIEKYGQSRFEDFVKTGLVKKKSQDGYSPSESVDTVSESTEISEEDYFQGTFGDILRGFDKVVPLGLGDFADDIARSVASGYYQGVSSEAASDLLMKGSVASEEDINDFINKQKKAAQLGPSAEMQKYQKIYEDSGKNFLGVVKGLLASGATIVPELILSSLTAMATNTDALKGLFGTLGTGALVGGGAGAAAGGVGAIPGAIAGASAAIPVAFGAATSLLEAGSTFAELLQDEIGKEEITNEDIKSVLEDEEKFKSFRNKAIARGLTIGAIDALTGKLGGSLGAKVLTKSGRIPAKATTKARKLAALGASTGVEGVGGSVGEISGRLVAGQEMDVSEIVLEGVAELPGGIKNMISARFSNPKYSINGKRVDKSEIDNVINNFSLEQIQNTKIKIDNDYEGTAQELQDRIEELSVQEQLLKANPNMNKPTLDAMTKLQLELNSLENNKTQIAKDKASELRAQIKELESKPLEVEGDNITEKLETKTESQDVISEFNELSSDEQAEYINKAEGDKTKAIELFQSDLKKIENIEFLEDVTSETTESEQIDDGITVTKRKQIVKSDKAPILEINKLTSIAKAGLKAARNIVPDLKIVIYNDQDLYNEINPSEGSVAEFDINTKTVHINASNAGLTTIPHELFHAVLIEKVGTDTANITSNMIQAVDQSLGKDSLLKKQLIKFSSQYDTSVQNEEQLAELTGILAANFKKLSKPEKNIILKYIKELGVKLGFEMKFINQLTTNEEAVIDLLNTLSRKFTTGEEITSQDVGMLEVETTSDPTALTRKQQLTMDFDDSELTPAEGQPPLSSSFVNEVSNFIKQARAQGVSEAAIKTVLKRKKVEEVVITESLKISEGEAQVKIKVDTIPEYTNIKKQIKKLVSEKKKVGNKLKAALRYLENSDIYKKATDIQREEMVRDVRKDYGAKQKSAPSVKTILGKIKDIKNITLSEKELYIKRLKDIQEGASTAKKAFIEASQLLSKEIKQMVKAGQVTTSQMADVIARFSKVNMFNPASIESFVDYMAKVFNDAEYANKIKFARSKRKRALKNVGTKLGISDAVVPQLTRLFSVDPSLIPDGVLDKYLQLVDMFGKASAVLRLPNITKVTQLVEDVLQQLDEERSMAMVLSDRFVAYKDKVIEDGKINYSKTINSMLKDEVVTENEYEVMKKYKNEVMPLSVKEGLSEAETKKQKDILLKQLNLSDIINIVNLPSRNERDLAKELKSLIKTKAVNSLSVQQLQNLLKVIDNINNGYLPHFTQVMVETLNSINDGKDLASGIEKAKPLTFSSIYSKLKSLVTKKGAIEEMVRRNPLFYIDQIFGDFKTKTIFKSLFGRAAQASSAFRKELKGVQEKVFKAEQAVLKSFKRNTNKFTMSKYKQMVYMIQQEFLSNPNSKQVNPASEFLKATIQRIDEGGTRYSQLDAEMLQEILDTYSDSSGNIDNDKLFDSFNKAEKESISIIESINKDLGPKAVYTSTVIRGDKITPLNNYVHLNVIHDRMGDDIMSTPSFAENFNASLKPSTRAKSLIERTGKVSPLNFDIYASVQRGSKFVLMDFYMTEPIRTARRTLNQAESELSKNGRIPSDKRKIFNAIKLAFEEATENLVVNSYAQTSIADDVVDYMQKQGYRAILAGTGRFIAELVSNVSFALVVDPKAFIEGTKLKGIVGTPKAPAIMSNLKSSQTNRIFPNEDLSGKLVDVNILNQATGAKGGVAKGTVSNIINTLWNKTGQRWVKGVEFVADSLISTPDKLMMRPMWFGSFTNRFKELTGKDPDFNKIAENDSEYMSQYKDALKEATEIADKRSVMAGATDNAFMGMLKGTNKPNQSAMLRGFNAFNNFMTRFLIFEYITARTGIVSAIGRGELSQKQGVAVLAGVTTRMVMYTLLGTILSESMISMFKGDDDELLSEEEPKPKSLDKLIGQSLASTFTSLLFGRDFGNATRIIVNEAVEQLNESQLEFLRDGEYDPYKDSIAYTYIPKGRQGKGAKFSDFLMRVGAAFGPALRTAELTFESLTEPTRKEDDAIERQKMERYIRIPLEILGVLGFIPLYKDVRKVVLSQIYGDLTRAQAQIKSQRKAKKEMLQGYDNESDMKRYDYDLWLRTFGPDSPDYDAIQAEKELKKQKREIKRQQKDELYNYEPAPSGSRTRRRPRRTRR